MLDQSVEKERKRERESELDTRSRRKIPHADSARHPFDRPTDRPTCRWTITDRDVDTFDVACLSVLLYLLNVYYYSTTTTNNLELLIRSYNTQHSDIIDTNTLCGRLTIAYADCVWRMSVCWRFESTILVICSSTFCDYFSQGMCSYEERTQENAYRTLLKSALIDELSTTQKRLFDNSLFNKYMIISAIQ